MEKILPSRHKVKTEKLRLHTLIQINSRLFRRSTNLKTVDVERERGSSVKFPTTQTSRSNCRNMADLSFLFFAWLDEKKRDVEEKSAGSGD